MYRQCSLFKEFLWRSMIPLLKTPTERLITCMFVPSHCLDYLNVLFTASRSWWCTVYAWNSRHSRNSKNWFLWQLEWQFPLNLCNVLWSPHVPNVVVKYAVCQSVEYWSIVLLCLTLIFLVSVVCFSSIHVHVCVCRSNLLQCEICTWKMGKDLFWYTRLHPKQLSMIFLIWGNKFSGLKIKMM